MKEDQKEMKMDHSSMDHSSHEGMKMSGMDHSNHSGDMKNMEGMDHGSHGGHGDHPGEMGGMDHSMHMGNFKQKFWLSLILAIPIIILSPMMGIHLPFQFTFPGSNWVVLILATVLFIYGGQPFLSGAKMELKMRNPGMMTLIAMGITVSYVYSLYAFVLRLLHPNAQTMDFFWELATLIVIMLLGHWIEVSAISNASSALKQLAELLPDQVVRIDANGKEETVSLQDVKKGDHLMVKAGDKMPADGVILDGSSIVDESAVTGESRGVEKKKGDKVIGGSVNGSGTMTIQVSATGQEGYLAQVMEMVKKAQSEKSRLESLSDRVAKWLFYVALSAGILAFVIWLFVADLSSALERMVTVFVIACPHALGLAIPLVVARSTSIAAKNGLLLKNRNALENGEAINMVMLDKTGTLTEGNFKLQAFEMLSDEYPEKTALQYVGALESSGNHPIAVGIMKALKEKNITPFTASDVKNLSGVGLQGTVEGKETLIVNEKYLKEHQLSVDPDKLKTFEEKGNTLSFLIIDSKLIALLALGDEIKPEAKSFIHELKARGVTPVMLTGDNPKAAEVVAKYLGIDDFHGGLLPDDKEKIVSSYLAKGKKVMMVGDGINDAPSLAKATIGMAIGAGTDIAIESADVVLTNSDPKDILHFLNLAKQTKRKMVQNLWWGAGYNIVTIPLAAGILAPIGFILSPAVGAILMSLSTVVVAINAMTLHLNK
ncbi:heavy metal translocating P-type ATPase [Enterococcus hirae]|nr:heavy metal translocating P-type ATPase [Enterococcus hirae]